MPTTIPNKDDGNKAAWEARLPFILAFCLGEQVQFRAPDDSDRWLDCKYNRFGMHGRQPPPRSDAYVYRILDKQGVEIDPDAYLASVLNGAKSSPAQGAQGGGGVVQAIVRMFDFNL